MNKTFPKMFSLALILAVTVSLLPTQALQVAADSTTVVISEFRVRGPNGGNDEFIELFNLSTSPVDISGMKIKGSNNTGFVSTRATIPLGTILNPGCYYLVTNSAAAGYSGTIPGNLTYNTGVTDTGGIALTLADDSVIDQVGLDNGSAFKEGTPLASLGTSNQDRGYERKPGGVSGNGTDTDNNSNDFQLITPSNPQNLNSPCLSSATLFGVGNANPDTVTAGNSTLLTITVTPGSNPTSTGLSVNVDLSQIGGLLSQPFFDDGSNGDVTAGDNVFSYIASVAVDTSAGPKTLNATIGERQTYVH
jgi:uncharacterized protein